MSWSGHSVTSHTLLHTAAAGGGGALPLLSRLIICFVLHRKQITDSTWQDEGRSKLADWLAGWLAVEDKVDGGGGRRQGAARQGGRESEGKGQKSSVGGKAGAVSKAGGGSKARLGQRKARADPCSADSAVAPTHLASWVAWLWSGLLTLPAHLQEQGALPSTEVSPMGQVRSRQMIEWQAIG